MLNPKVTIIHHYGGIGGAGKSLINNILFLSKFYDITVIIPSLPNDIYLELSKLQNLKIITVSFVPSLPFYSGGFNWFDPRLFLHLFKSLINYKEFLHLVRNTDPEYIISNSLITCWLGIFFKDLKTICFVRETIKKSLFNYIQRFLLCKFNKVVFLSEYDKSSWNLSSDTMVIQNYCDNDFINEANNKNYKNIPNDTFNLFFLGGTSYIKGFYFLALALYKLRKYDDLKCYVVGDCNKFIVKLYKFILRGHCSFLFVGKVFDTSIYYQNSDIVIFPVVKVHQGRPIFESGFFSKCIIVPDYENFSEYVINNYNGIIYKKGSISSLVKAIEYAYCNRNTVKRMGGNNLLLSSKNHTNLIAEKKINLLMSSFK